LDDPLKRYFLWSLLFLAGFAVAFVVVVKPEWEAARDEAVDLARVHLAYEVAHPGWSFPARVWSSAVELDQPRVRLISEAKARGYTELCPPRSPGDFCAKTGQIVLRGGYFPEGAQPPGLEGWSRPPALEPVLLGWMIGPDGEIRQHLPLERAPKTLLAALLTAEDEDYRAHSGVNLKGVARAIYQNARGSGVQQGASTLTMQLVRNLKQDKEKTWRRKVREAVAAVAIDQALGKDVVLGMYLDAPYLGQWGGFSICGFQAAAQYYWGIDAADLNLSQAATLAAILPAPGKFAPDKNPDEAKRRRDRVLKRMAEVGAWPAAEVTAALAASIDAAPHPLPEARFPAYLQATRSWLEQNVPPETLYGAGLEIFTALDVGLQVRTEAFIPERLKYLERAVGRNGKEPLQTAGALIENHSGLLVAVYGGEVAVATDFSLATQAKRQAGSSMKPLVYALGFSVPGEGGHPKYTAAHTVPNSPREFKGTNGWRPRNVGGEYSVTDSLAHGLAWSQNIATASLLEEVGGAQKLIDFASRVGIDTKAWPAEMGLALGQGEVTPLEMARFASTVVRGGELASGRPVAIAYDPNGAVRIAPPATGERILTEEAAALTRDLMRLVIEVGTGGASRGGAGFPGYDGPAIGKTGTTDSEKDLWFIGGTPYYSAAIWLGYDQPKRIGAAASDLTAPLWGWWMREVHDGLPRSELPGLKLEHKGICTTSGKRPNASCRVINAPFLPGTAPKEGCGAAHPPPDPEAPDHESLWERKRRLAEEKAALDAGIPLPIEDEVGRE
jgi:penicillin-binding protein 1A